MRSFRVSPIVETYWLDFFIKWFIAQRTWQIIEHLVLFLLTIPGFINGWYDRNFSDLVGEKASENKVLRSTMSNPTYEFYLQLSHFKSEVQCVTFCLIFGYLNISVKFLWYINLTQKKNVTLKVCDKPFSSKYSLLASLWFNNTI